MRKKNHLSIRIIIRKIIKRRINRTWDKLRSQNKYLGNVIIEVAILTHVLEKD